jgi:transposase
VQALTPIGASSMSDPPELGQRDGRIPDALWARIHPRLPLRQPPPLGSHRPRVDDRRAMAAIFVVLRPGCHWHALHATGLCSRSAAHCRFQEWAAAGVVLTLWPHGLAAYDALPGIAWQWLAREGAMTKAPLGGEQGRQEPHRSGEERHQTPPAHRRRRRAYRPCRSGGQSP